MFDLISIGNISIDLYFKGEMLTRDHERFKLAIGGKYLADHFYEGIGGGGINVAIGVSHFGYKSAIVGKIGNNQFKHLILEHMKDRSVSSQLCTFQDEYLKISAVLLSPDGERTVINYETPHNHIFTVEEEFNKIEKAKIVYMSNLPTVPLAERIRVVHHLHAHKVPIVLNLGIKDCRRPVEQVLPLLEKVDVLILNSHEFSELVKHSYKKIDLKKKIYHYLPTLLNKITVITDGENGSYSYFKDDVCFQEALPASNIVDTLGAGDAYTAGFIASYLKTSDIKKSMFHGAQYAVHIIEKIGAN